MILGSGVGGDRLSRHTMMLIRGYVQLRRKGTLVSDLVTSEKKGSRSTLESSHGTRYVFGNGWFVAVMSRISGRGGGVQCCRIGLEWQDEVPLKSV